MIRVAAAGPVVLLLGVLLTACADIGSESANNVYSSAIPKSAAQSKGKKDAAQTIERASQRGGKLVIYSPNEMEINNPIMKEFQDRTGIQVEMATGGTGDLLNRIKAESSNTHGDLMFGGTVESLDAYKEYFESYISKELPNLNSKMTDPDNIWMPFTTLPMVILYNKDLVQPGNEPKKWSDLLNTEWKGKIAYANPAKSGSSYTQLATMLTVFGNNREGWSYIEKFADNLDGKLLPNSGMVPKGVADQEYSVGVTLEENALRYVEAGARVGIVYPAEGTTAIPDGMAVIKGAKNIENAKLFIEFATGKDVQSLMQTEFKRRSVRTDLDPAQGVTPISDIKLIDYSLKWASAQRAANIDRFTQLAVKK